MELICSRLESGGHSATGRETVLCAVVGGERLELSQGIHGGHNAEAARTAAIIPFTTVQQVDVVPVTVAIKTYAAVTAHWSGCLKVSLKAGGARCQIDQCINAAAIGGELRNLLTGDDVADFAGIRLDVDHNRLDRDRL